MTDRDALMRLLAEHSIRRGKFVLASGKISSIYVDARLTTMSPEGMTLIGPIALQKIRTTGWNPDSIGGLTLGADPISFAISYASSISSQPLRAFTVRKETKSHGTRNLIEGPFIRGDQVVIIEDVITTGKSAIQAIEAVYEADGKVLGVLALIDREEGGLEAVQTSGHNVLSILSIREILEIERNQKSY
ncbi:MAG: orotate phosphoribosyltransferase [Gemmatimonadaceae bacterium]|nr:orotate phosphoribosyltransferase [Gemmatimonadaceae bacterium]